MMLALCIMFTGNIYSIPGTDSIAYATNNENSTQSILISNTNSYEKYLDLYKSAKRPVDSINLDYKLVKEQSKTGIEYLPEYNEKVNVIRLSGSDNYIVYEFNVLSEGFYNIQMLYMPFNGQKHAQISLSMEIDDKIPYNLVNGMNFTRPWGEDAGFKQDSRGNDLQKSQTEKSYWLSSNFYDSEGKYNDPLLFYLSAGKHTLKIIGLQTDFILSSLKIYNDAVIPDYNKIQDEYKEKGYESQTGAIRIYQGENIFTKSDSTITALFDKSDPETQPNDAKKLKLNTIGGLKWQTPGQWISWKINADKSGLYQISIKARQNFKSGFFSTRKLYIDDIVPFKECEAITFDFKNIWENNILGTVKNPYLFYLSKGEHEIKLEVVPGAFSQTSIEIEKSIYLLNTILRNVIMVAGNTPDKYRDYYLDKEIPGLDNKLKDILKILTRQKQIIIDINGKTGGEMASIQSLINQLENFIKNPDELAIKIDTFKTNIAGLAAWNMKLREQPLEIDYISVFTPDEKLPNANGGFFEKIWFEINKLFASYDKNSGIIGDYYSEDEALNVWVSMGRDQLQIIKELVDSDFVANNKIKVNVNLVPSGIREAVMAGKGPDVALFIASDEPINLALRGSVINLSQFDTFGEVRSRFVKNSTLPFEFNGKCYALPLTQSYPMLFVRTDIFKELNLKIPQTWDDIYNIAPKLQRKNMEIGIPSSIGMFATLLYQNGGKFFNNSQTKTNFGEKYAIDAFKTWTDFFVKYDFPLQYDFYNRFRTGEMPIGFASYTMYNMLSVAAPEISGQWVMAPICGVMKENGVIDRGVCSGEVGTSGLDQGVTTAIMLKGVKNKENAWKFLDWFTSTDVQASFGILQETIMGPTARYPTANIEAFKRLPWKNAEKKILLEQWNNLKPIEEIPGNYYVTRHLNNAFRQTTYFYENPVHTLNKYNIEINKEILRKRAELGLN